MALVGSGEHMVIVVNLDEINRALTRTGPLYYKAMRNGLLQGAEPIRQDAGRLSMLKLSGMKRAKAKPPPWSIQRKGQTVHEVYVAPRERSRRRGDDPMKRRNFSPLMMEKAFEPALERNENRTRLFVDEWLTKVVNGFNTGGIQ